MKWVHVVAMGFTTLLFGCGGVDTSKAPSGEQSSPTVDMPHYSFTIPAEWKSWSIKKQGGPMEAVTLTEKACCAPPIEWQVTLLRNTIATAVPMTAKEVAADYSKREENTMISEGVMKGRYKLYDLVRTEESLDGRTAYVMHYRTEIREKCQKAGLYLLFPKESNIEWFIVAHYSFATTREWGDILKLCSWGEGEDFTAHQFVEMLKGLQMH
jgi:hypothetical protein